MSKSRGNIVRTETILEGFGALKPDLPKAEQDLFGADALRYFLLREIVFGQDGSFTSTRSSSATTPIWPTATATSSAARYP